jgi:hypothetical protein
MTVTTHNNLLTGLNRWAERQEENFISEAFVHLLKHLIAHEPNAAAQLIRWLTNERLNLSAPSMPCVKISTQVHTPEGRPDIEIRTSDHLVYIEVKINSDFEIDQLARYRRHLLSSSPGTTTLVTITRFPIEVDPGCAPDISRRWHEIAALLKEPPFYNIDGVSGYVLQQFVEFLSTGAFPWKKSNGS